RQLTAPANRERCRSGLASFRYPLSAQRARNSGAGGSWDFWDRRPPTLAPDAARRPRIRSQESSVSVSCLRFRGWHFAEQTKEILGGLARNLLKGNSASLRQHLGDFDHV